MYYLPNFKSLLLTTVVIFSACQHEQKLEKPQVYHVEQVLSDTRRFEAMGDFFVDGIVEKGISIPPLLRGFVLSDPNSQARVWVIPYSKIIPLPSNTTKVFKVKIYQELVIGSKRILVLREI